LPESPSKTTPRHHLTSGVRPHAAVPRASECARIRRRSPGCSRAKLADLHLYRNAGLSFEWPLTTMLEHFCAPASVVVVQTLARLLSSPVTAFCDGVVDGERSRCAVSIDPSPTTSPTRIEVLQRVLRSLTVFCRYVPPLPACPCPAQLMRTAEYQSLDRRGCLQCYSNGSTSMLSMRFLSTWKLSTRAHAHARARMHTIRGASGCAFCAACAGHISTLPTAEPVSVVAIEAGREEERTSEAMCERKEVCGRNFYLID
jgi:hypothetical protein